MIQNQGLGFSTQLAIATARARNVFGSKRPQLSLITDFGDGDEAVFAVKSAARFVNPRIEIIDICHNVPAFNVLIGAHRLKRNVALPTEPEGAVYVAVVDPGVGGSRDCIIVKTRTGKYLVGPDNGVLSLAFATEGIHRVVLIENRDLTLLDKAQSKTFHGRDVFAPVAAHILRGVPLREFGSDLDPGTIVKIAISTDSTATSRAGWIVDGDGFGVIRTNVPNHVPRQAIGRLVAFTLNGGQVDITDRARLVETFDDSKPGETVLVLSSTGCLDLAVNRGNALERFGINFDQITLDGLQPRLKVSVRFDN
ncbi:Chlorinase [Candidatus Bilamarchaeum dharawalense]|uniref:Chlorinase n=1 Tax=Candidatus Bilamarchaeum dharawalense TaxID=2885759 RepID=A0A5E4LPD7_9ARCH|nr:Chlorinase [Candidatus Bilamarchaeum dharawalense]